MEKSLVPPDTIEHLSDEELAPFKTEYDVVTTLHNMGHEVRCLGISDDLGIIRDTIEEFSPHILFNLLEEFGGQAVFDQNVVSYLQVLRVAYTGCGPRGLMLARDKALSKQIMAFHRIPVPEFAVFRRGRRIQRPRRLEFPLFVKSLNEEASLGIAQASLVEDEERLAERVKFIHERIGTDAIAERYIDGRELYVGVIGNHKLEVLPVWELLFTKMPEDAPRIATAKVKWDYKYQEKWGIRSEAARDLPPGLPEKIAGIARRIYRCLDLSGYARIDFRLTPEGQLYVLEANPNPQLAYGEDFAESAQAGGIGYPELLQRIVNLGLRRAAQPVV